LREALTYVTAASRDVERAHLVPFGMRFAIQNEVKRRNTPPPVDLL
jgi:hypothetical protein